MKSTSKVVAVVVTYNPDLVHLETFIEKLCVQFDEVIIIDNLSSEIDVIEQLPLKYQRVVVEKNAENLGIGAAQNRGVRLAFAEGATHIVLFDQDSMVSEDFRVAICDAEKTLKDKGVRVAAIGPKLIDQTTGNVLPFIAFRRFFKKRISQTAPDEIVECFSLLSSGTLISRESFAAVGELREDLFLEYVDVEWGARARKLGLKSYGVGSPTLLHNLGDERLTVGPIVIPLHSPLRHYYTMRNAVLMQKHPALPIYWKVYDFVRTARGFLLFALFNPPRIKQIKFMLLGLYHGARGKSGPYKVER